MKKIVAATIIGTAGLILAVGTSYGQGTINLNNFDQNVVAGVPQGVGVFLLTTGTAAPAGTMVEVLAGATASSLSPVISFNTGLSTYTFVAGDVNANGAGKGSFFDYGYGHIPTVAPQASAFVEVLIWDGGATYSTSVPHYDSGVFSQLTGTSPAAPGTPAPTTLGLTGQNIILTVPEPGTMALCGLGAASLLLFRRRK